MFQPPEIAIHLIAKIKHYVGLGMINFAFMLPYKNQKLHCYCHHLYSLWKLSFFVSNLVWIIQKNQFWIKTFDVFIDNVCTLNIVLPQKIYYLRFAIDKKPFFNCSVRKFINNNLKDWWKAEFHYTSSHNTNDPKSNPWKMINQYYHRRRQAATDYIVNLLPVIGNDWDTFNTHCTLLCLSTQFLASVKLGTRGTDTWYH